MNKSKFYILIIVGLLISNAIMLLVFISRPKMHKEPKIFIIDKLHLDNEQIRKYDVYIQTHRKAVKDNEATMKKLRNELYKQLKYKQDTLIINALVVKIANQQKKAEGINYNHFLEIKKLCKTSQQKNFDELTNEIANLFSRNQRK